MRAAGVRRLAALFTIVLGAGVLPAAMSPAIAVPDNGSFTALRGFEPTGAKVRVNPRDYAASRVDLAALRGELPSGSTSAVISIPDPSGRLVDFRVVRTQRMESELAAANPEITTYSGRGVDDPRSSIALDLTPMGFHASVRQPGGQGAWYVDPAYNRRGTTEHLSYFAKSLSKPEQRRAEGEVDTIRKSVDAKITANATDADEPVTRKIYRLALTSDQSYAAFFGTANVLSEKVTLMNRVNQIYNDDLAIDLRLVNATDSLNLDTDAKAIEPNGPCGAAPCFRLEDLGDPADPDDDLPGDLDFCSGLTLGQNRTVLGQLVGASNYDIGHIALGKNGGGVAYLGVVGGDYKGGGCTGLPKPIGDFFAIDYVAHEMGHQFAGNHTFNGAAGNCGGNISEASVEPGSGSSVMAYAGICRQDNLQEHSDPYFSFNTVDEATAYTEQLDYSNIEVQTASLRDFDPATDTLSVAYGAGAPVPVAAYTPAGIEAAVEAASGQDVSIAEWGYDEFLFEPAAPPVAPDETGFQVIFNSTPSIVGADETDLDLEPLTVTATGGATGFVGETAQGGPALNAGSSSAATDNISPEVKAPEDETIPMRTPFALTGTGTDADGDALTYLWEQADFGSGTRLADNTKLNGPLFRMFSSAALVSDEDSLKTPAPGINIADDNTTRVFPDMAQVLAGNTNAATGDCPPPVDEEVVLTPSQLECFSEYLPKPGYVGTLGNTEPSMRFRFTARDLFPTGGGLSFADVTLKLDPSAGPFLVTSQATPGATVAGGTSVPVTWAVNNTQGLASNVKITASTDGGATFNTVLSASTPNDGTESLTMPNVDASDVRIKIEAVDNYFFAVNDASFKLAATPAPGVPDTTITAGPADGAVVLDPEQAFTYASTLTPATFVCRVDGDTVPCAASGLTESFTAGTHEFSVAAVNSAGVADPTPATRSFTVPFDDGQVRRQGDWKRVKKAAAYGGDFLTSKDRGAQLVKRIRGADRITLVVSTRRNAGQVKVFLGKDRIRTFSLKGKSRVNRLRTVVLDKPRSGKLRIVVGQHKPVRIEGVAVVTDPR